LEGASALFEDSGLSKQPLEPRLCFGGPVERITESLPIFGAELEVPRLGNLLRSPDARTLQNEICDIHSPLLGSKPNEPRFPFAEANVKSLGALLAGCGRRHNFCSFLLFRTYNVRLAKEHVKA
jgi:hypothetical protein